LASLVVDQSNDYEYFCHKYKTSNNIKNRLGNISINIENMKSEKFYSKENIKKLIYLSSREHVNDLLLFSISANNKIKNFNVEKLIDFAIACEIPKFPISGNYLKKYGYETGHALGKKLKLLEEQWIKNNFDIDKKIVRKSLGRVNEN
jgi:poly(A) polymerase